MDKNGLLVAAGSGAIFCVVRYMRNPNPDPANGKDGLLYPILFGSAGGILGWYLFDPVMPSQTILSNVLKGAAGKMIFSFFLHHV